MMQPPKYRSPLTQPLHCEIPHMSTDDAGSTPLRKGTYDSTAHCNVRFPDKTKKHCVQILTFKSQFGCNSSRSSDNEVQNAIAALSQDKHHVSCKSSHINITPILDVAVPMRSSNKELPKTIESQHHAQEQVASDVCAAFFQEHANCT